MNRICIVTIDNILALLKDYAGEALDLPEDAKPSRLMFRPTDRGKLGLLVESDTWIGNRPAEEVKFDLRRTYSV